MLPSLLLPPSLPSFLAAGHELAIDDPFGLVERGSGHSRRRRLYTAITRTVQVSLDLSEEQAAIFEAFFEDTLQAGARRFAAKVAAEDGVYRYFDALWLEPWTADPRPSPNGPRWVFSGVLQLDGEGELEPPSDANLELEVSAALVASGTITPDPSLALEVYAYLTPGATMAVEFFAYLQVETLGGDELREDGDRELREDGDAELRE